MEPKLAKELGLMAAALIMSGVEFWFFTIMGSAAVGSLLLTIVLVLLSMSWVMIVALALGLIKTRALAAATIIGIVLMVALVGRSWASVSGGMLAAIFMWLAQQSFAREASNRILYRTAQIFGPGVRLLLFSLITALVSLALTLVVASLTRQPLTITEHQVNPLLAPVTPLIQNVLPGYTPESTIDELLRARIDEELKRLPDDLQVNPEQQVALSREQVERQLGQELSGQERLGTLVARTLNRLVQNVASRNPLLTSFLVIIFMFLALRALAPFLVWPIIGGVALLLTLLRQAGFINRVTLSAEVERLEL